MTKLQLKRVYDSPSTNDGRRILVDRLWPRGLKKESAAIDDWLRDIAPSDALRQWFGHDPSRWGEFQARYAVELEHNGEIVTTLRALLNEGPATLLFSAKDTNHNNAVALKAYLEASPGRP